MGEIRKDNLHESLLNEITKTINNDFYVSVKEFGAVGDGVSDDTEAFLECINEAMRLNKVVYIPSGVYIIAPAILSFELADNQNLIMKGDGFSSVLKRKDGTTTSDWQVLFRIRTKTTNVNNVSLVRIENLKIDGNATNQQEPPADKLFAFEHSASFYIAGYENSRIKNVQVENVMATDAVADHIYIPGSGDSFVDNLLVNNFICDYRTRTRSDICVTGWVKSAIFSNINCITLEYEINNGEGFDSSYVFLNNIDTQRIDLASNNGDLAIYGSNIVTRRSTYLTSLKGKIVSSCFTFTEGDRVLGSPDVLFDGCDFIMTTKTTTEEDTGNEIKSLNNINIEYSNNISFTNCTFKTDGGAESYSEPLVYVHPRETTDNNVYFNSCQFDEKVGCAIVFDRCGYCVVENCNFYNNIPLLLNSGNYKLDVTLKNIKMLGEGICMKINSGSATNFFLRIDNMICSDKNMIIETANSSSLQFAEFECTRKIFINEPITRDYLYVKNGSSSLYFKTFKGDEFINLKSAMNEPTSWKTLINGSNRTDKMNDWMISEGRPMGTTENRPTCFISIGFVYFDTTINKPIWWTGAKWVDSNGADV